MTEWISVKDRVPPANKPVIVYGNMSSHWPDITYAKWNPNTKSWKNCFAYGGDELIREEEVSHWLDLKLPEGRHE